VKTPLRILAVLALSTLAACGGAGSPEGPVAASTATYRVTFHTDWTQSAFPTQFPVSRHFSGLVGATHNDAVKFWDENEKASLGIQNMAEKGDKTALLEEVDGARKAGHVDSVLSGGGIGANETEVTLEFAVATTHPYVTLVSMVAPSPDWFVGVRKLALFHSNQWQDKVTVPLEVYDAGTDDGVSFVSADINAVPHVAIQTLTSAASDTDFLSGLHRSTGRVVGTFTFERLR